jgi:hypothetical protein
MCLVLGALKLMITPEIMHWLLCYPLVKDGITITIIILPQPEQAFIGGRLTLSTGLSVYSNL